MIKFTHVTSANPSRVSKVYGLDEEGGLRKGETSANLSSAHLEIMSIAKLEDFTVVLGGLNSTNCLIYGIPAGGQGRLVTQTAWCNRGKPTDAVPRTAEAFCWPKGAGIVMLDYDAPKSGGEPLSKDDMLAMVDKAMGGSLTKIDHIWWPSTSSCLWHGEKQLSGIKGQRIYFAVDAASDIPRAGKVLAERLWGMGFGRFEISVSGQLLERTLIDTSVWQSNRIDFAAGAICENGLEQRRGSPQFFCGQDRILDSRVALPDLNSDELAAAFGAKNEARRQIRPAADAIKEKWISERADELLKRISSVADDKTRRASALHVARRAVEDRELAGDWPIRLADGREVTVVDILTSPEKFHQQQTFDPVEPDYDGGRVVGKLYLIGGRPNLFSFAHGGITYRLQRELSRIQVVKGGSYDMSLATVSVMRQSKDFYNYDKALVSAGGDGKIRVHNQDSLFHALGGITRYWYDKENSKTGEADVLYCDPPLQIVKSVLSMDDTRELPTLTAINTAPTMRLDGTVLSTTGYDVSTGLLFIPRGNIHHINISPGLEEAKAALAFLWKPFEGFPFADRIDRAAHLAALFSSVVRPVLPTCPAVGYDAPTRGSGKTLLARCIGILSSGAEPPVYAPTDSEEEIRKRLTTILMGGELAFVWDNVVGQFDSPAIAAFLTGVKSADRILGVSKQISLPNRALMTVTGNNLHPVGDMARRIVTARIDPASNVPFLRSFDLAPDAFCLEHRQKMVAAALTVMSYHFNVCGGEHLGAGNTASFEHWDRLVRQSVLRVDSDIAPGQFGDVAELFQASMVNDPAHEAVGLLLRAIVDLVGTEKYFTAAELHEKAKAGKANYSDSPVRISADRFFEALHELAPRKAASEWTSRALGQSLHYRNGAVHRNLRLMKRVDGDRAVYRVERLVSNPGNSGT